MSTPRDAFEDVRVHVRFKISALWIATLLIFAYGDIFGFFKPGRIQEVAGGSVSGIAINQAFLLATSAYIVIASAMVFLSLVLRPPVARWVNVVFASLFAISVVVSVPGEWAYYYLLSAAELVLLLSIVWYAWRWPRVIG